MTATPPSETETNKALFLNLVMMLTSSAMQQLGKVVNPLSGKAEVRLDAAQFNIDMLEMLKAKTSGNLDRDEEHLLRDSLASLQLNYVETAEQEAARGPAAGAAKAAQDAAAPAAEEAAPSGSAPSSGPAAPDGKPAAEAPREPKFRKSYGA